MSGVLTIIGGSLKNKENAGGGAPGGYNVNLRMLLVAGGGGGGGGVALMAPAPVTRRGPVAGNGGGGGGIVADSGRTITGPVTLTVTVGAGGGQGSVASTSIWIQDTANGTWPSTLTSNKGIDGTPSKIDCPQFTYEAYGGGGGSRGINASGNPGGSGGGSGMFTPTLSVSPEGVPGPGTPMAPGGFTIGSVTQPAPNNFPFLRGAGGGVTATGGNPISSRSVSGSGGGGANGAGLGGTGVALTGSPNTAPNNPAAKPASGGSGGDAQYLQLLLPINLNPFDRAQFLTPPSVTNPQHNTLGFCISQPGGTAPVAFNQLSFIGGGGQGGAIGSIPLNPDGLRTGGNMPLPYPTNTPQFLGTGGTGGRGSRGTTSLPSTSVNGATPGFNGQNGGVIISSDRAATSVTGTYTTGASYHGDGRTWYWFTTPGTITF